MSKDTEPIPTDDWYEVHRHDNGVLAIGEPHHAEEVFCYLIKGSDRSLLIDTGMGVRPIRPLIEKLNQGKLLTVVNTHWHFDHIGGNADFDSVLIPANAQELRGIENGWSAIELRKYFFFDGFWHDRTPEGFSQDFGIPGYKGSWPVLREGWEFDLGGRLIKVVSTPGHTPGSISLVDTTNGLLFSSDLLYEGPLYAFEDESDPEEYLRSLKRLKAEVGSSIKIIHPGHNHSALDGVGLLDDAIALFERALAGGTPDGINQEFPGIIEYNQPGEGRRLKVLIKEDANR